MNYQQLFEDYGITFVNSRRTEMLGVCPKCHRPKLYCNRDSGVFHCKTGSCGFSGNATTLLATDDPRATAQTLHDQYGIVHNHQPEKKPEAPKPLAYGPLAAATERQIEDLCSAKVLIARDLKILTSGQIGYYHDSSQADPRIMLPGWSPTGYHGLKEPAGWLEIKIDGSPWGPRKKYKLTLNSKHGLIGLDRVLKENPQEIVLCEGWRDAVATTGYDVYALALTGGASSFHDSWLPFFAGRTVYLVLDSDDAGRAWVDKHGQKIAAVATAVYDCRLPPNGQDKDLYDWSRQLNSNTATFRELLSSSQQITAIKGNATVENIYPQTLAGYYQESILPDALKYHNTLWYKWIEKIQQYEYVQHDTIKRQICRMCNLLKVKKSTKDYTTFQDFAVTQPLVENTLFSLSSFDDVSIENHPDSLPPFFISRPDMTTDLIAMSDCLLDISRDPHVKLPPDRDWLTTFYLPYTYDPAAKCPLWEKFVRETFQQPDESQQSGFLWDLVAEDLVQRFCGLLLTADTRYQVILGIIGVRRSGKGTFVRVIQKMLGAKNFVSTSFKDLANSHGLESLVGKSLAVIPDAKISQARADMNRAIEVLKNISGEDYVQINPKNKQMIGNVKLNCRFIVVANEAQALHDPSGALNSRFRFVQCSTSHEANPDIHLYDKLIAELPGIFNWALAGLIRLRRSKTGFTGLESAAGKDVRDEFDSLAQPLIVFLREECVVGPGEWCDKIRTYSRYREWSIAQGRGILSNQQFYINLHALNNNIRKGPHWDKNEKNNREAFFGFRMKYLSEKEYHE